VGSGGVPMACASTGWSAIVSDILPESLDKRIHLTARVDALASLGRARPPRIERGDNHPTGS